MKPPLALGRHYQTGRPIRILAHDGRIAALEDVATQEEDLPWLAPALVDLQINGFAGSDFQRDDPTIAAAEQAARVLAQAGTGRILLTLVTDQWPLLIHRIRQWRALRDGSPAWRQLAVGWHIEGPFLSPEPGYCGAHATHCLRDPQPNHLLELKRIVDADPVLLTLAPERPGALVAIRQAVDLGFRVSLGHTNADAACLHQAWEAGARGFTHLGNACPQQLDRHDNILWRVLDLAAATELRVSLIPDGIHVAPALFRLLHRALGPERCFYVSDAMAAAGAPPGSYTLGPLQLNVGEDGVVRQPGRSNFAGSALRPVEGVFRAAAMLGRRWQDCWDAFSVRPAHFMGWAWGLVPGAPAVLCQLWTNQAQSPTPSTSLCRLEVLSEQITESAEHR